MKLKNLFAKDSSSLYSSMDGDNEFCCGKHVICKKSLPPRPARNTVEYFDDEELDVFKGRSADTYTEEEIRQFEQIFETLWKTDVSDWANSLSLRGIELPRSIQEIVAPLRN
jgi:hypothetical protein